MLGSDYKDRRLYPSCRDSVEGNTTYKSMSLLVPEMLDLLKENFHQEYNQISNAEAESGHCLNPKMLEKMKLPLDPKEYDGSTMMLMVYSPLMQMRSCAVLVSGLMTGMARQKTGALSSQTSSTTPIWVCCHPAFSQLCNFLGWKGSSSPYYCKAQLYC